MKRKKPRIFLTPELKAYYRTQYPSLRVYMTSSQRRVNSQVYRVAPYMDRLEKLESIHPLIGYFMSVNAKPGSLEDLTSVCVALTKDVLTELKPTLLRLADSLEDKYTSVAVIAYDTQRSSEYQLELPDDIRDRLKSTLPEDTDIRYLDWIFDRTRYFNVEHIDIRVLTKEKPGEDTFAKSARIDALLARVIDIVEFVGESVDMMNQVKNE